MSALSASQLTRLYDGMTCRYVNNFEAALFGPNFMDPVTGWRMYGNPTTFVDFFLTTEIIKNAKHTYHGTSFANKVDLSTVTRCDV